MQAFEIAERVRYLDDLKLRTSSIDVSKKSNYEAGLAQSCCLFWDKSAVNVFC